MDTTALSRRDRAILAAVAAGRCSVGSGSALLVDGRCCSDQFAVARLSSAGWIRAVPPPADAQAPRAELTAAGRHVLAA